MKKNMMKLTSRIFALFLTLVLLVSAVPVTTNAAEKDDTFVVVSLGDSYSSGEGIEPYYGQEKELPDRVKDLDWLAHRSQKSWPGKLTIPGTDEILNNYNVAEGKATDNYKWYFVAVSGALTENMCISQQEKKYCKVYRKDVDSAITLTDTVYLDPQLDVFDDITEEIDYVTMTIGGNDVEFSKIVEKCVKGSTYLGSTKLKEELDRLWKDIDKYKAKIKTAYYLVENAAKEQGSDPAIIVAGYPQLFSPDGAGLPISLAEAIMVNESVLRFNQVLKDLVREFQIEGMNIHFVDVQDGFWKHQAYADEPWINEISLVIKEQDLGDKKVGSASSVHPNEKGAEKYAELVSDRINALENAGTLVGTVCDASDRKTKIGYATVWIENRYLTRVITADYAGNFSVDLPAGTYSVTTSADGYSAATTEIIIEEKEATRIGVFLESEGKEEYTITYASDVEVSSLPEPQTKTAGVPLTLSEEVPWSQYHTFKGWQAKIGGKTYTFQPGDTFNYDCSVTLKAVWGPAGYVYDANSGKYYEMSETFKEVSAFDLSGMHHITMSFDLSDDIIEYFGSEDAWFETHAPDELGSWDFIPVKLKKKKLDFYVSDGVWFSLIGDINCNYTFKKSENIVLDVQMLQMFGNGGLMDANDPLTDKAYSFFAPDYPQESTVFPTFTRSGYTLQGWGNAPDSTKVIYKQNAVWSQITTKYTKLYAIWKKK